MKVAILRVPTDSAIREKRASEILSKWRIYYRPLVTAALTVFDNSPAKVSGYCREIIQRWDSDITYAMRQKIPKYTGYIIKAMSHPDLQNDAKLAAFGMLLKEKQEPGFLDEALYQQAQEICDGKTLPWDSEFDKE